MKPMTPERWQRIQNAFHAALECLPADRATFLKEICDGDEDLQDEVRSLLGAHEQDSSFLDTPAYQMAAEVLTESFGGLLQGHQIGPYKILSHLGAGGMGEVYLAHDDRLGRKVALKLLPPDFAGDNWRVKRFAQEARAASALNHPNVCVIHEIGQTSDGRHFIAMEFIDGVTLRERVARGPLPLGEALSVAEQIAAALAAAHAAGVVHRDVKPENIMLRKDGYVKVLDFGLAKLSEPQADRTASATIATVKTEPGMQMGTVRYMAPEHLRERPVDERADIWSFGIVLHEMVTGVTPFEARTRNEIIASILRKQPKFEFSDAVPLEYQRIVSSTLSKNRRDRYQNFITLGEDLKRLRRQIEGDSAPGPLTPSPEQPHSRRQFIRKNSRDRVSPVATTAHWSTALTYISQTAGHLITGIRNHPAVSVLAVVTVVVAAFFALGSGWFVTSPKKLAHFQTIKMTPLTNAGRSVSAAISPDSKVFAHAEMKDGMQELLLTNIATESTSVVVPAREFKYRGITFSRDANYLYLTIGERNQSGALYQVSLPAGTPRKLKAAVDSPITFSPTGDRFAFVRFDRSKAEYSLIIATVEGSEERSLAVRRNGDSFSLYGPAWSPDGRTIACGAGRWDNGYQMKLIGFDADDGHETPMGERQWYQLSQVVWLDNGNQLIATARERWTSPYQLWSITYPSGESFRITSDTNEYERVSVSQDGNTILALQNRQLARMWMAPDGEVTRAHAITSNVGPTYGMDWSGSSRIIYSSLTGTNLNISSVNPDGSNRVQLTVNAGDNCMPAASRDGRFVVFTSNRNGSFNIWRMNAEDGSDARQLTFTDGNFYPSCSPDGQWVAYHNQSRGVMRIYRVPLDGGEPQLVTEHARMPVVSSDNRLIAYRHYPEGGAPEIAIMPLQGGARTGHLPIPIMDWQRLQWTPDDRALTYIKTANDVSNIWSYELASGIEKPLTNFTSDQVFAYAWSPDFKQLACLRGTEVRDVTMIRNQP